MERVFGEAAYAVLFMMGSSFVHDFIVWVFDSPERTERVVEALYCFGKTVQRVFIGFFAKLYFLCQEGVFSKDHGMRIGSDLGFFKSV